LSEKFPIYDAVCQLGGHTPTLKRAKSSVAGSFADGGATPVLNCTQNDKHLVCSADSFVTYSIDVIPELLFKVGSRFAILRVINLGKWPAQCQVERQGPQDEIIAEKIFLGRPRLSQCCDSAFGRFAAWSLRS
jgi:hypothetical protein